MNYEIDMAKLDDGNGNTGLIFAIFVVTFPTGVFDFPIGNSQASADVSYGSILLASGGTTEWNISANAPADGVLIIDLSAKPGTGINSTAGGSLVFIDFPVLLNPTAPTPENIQVVSTYNTYNTNIDSASGGAYAAASLGLPLTGSVTIVPAGSLLITTANQLSWTANQPGVVQSINATGGTAPYTFSSTGTLPAGLTLSTGGVISGTPTMPGTYSLLITATDSAGSSISQSFTVTVYGPLTLIPPALGSGLADYYYFEDLWASGGVEPYTLTTTADTLPPGLTLYPNGVLSGTPTVSGDFSFTITAIDPRGNTGTNTYTLFIKSNVAITTTSLPKGFENTLYNQTLAVTGGNGSYLFGLSAGTLPFGITMSSSGVLSGNPITTGNFTFTVYAVDTQASRGSQTYTITIKPTPMLADYKLTTQPPGSTQAGQATLVTVQAYDQYLNPITNYHGPSSVTVSISPTNSGSVFPATLPINGNGVGLFLASEQKASTYNITVADSSHTFTGYVPWTVTPGPATRLAFFAQPQNTPTGNTLPVVGVQVEDQYGNTITSDNTDTVTLGIGSGPGGFGNNSMLSAVMHNGLAIFSNLTLITPGTYQLSALVLGKYTGPFSAPFTIAPLQVVPGSLVGSPSGFSLQFNAPFLVNATNPVLYGPGGPPPSVIVTTDPGNLGDRAAYVAGSLMANSAAHTITFVATDTTLEANNGSPILPDGTYTVIVRGSAAMNGFQALNAGGGFLDGLGTGTAGSGDFTATFTVNAAAAGDDVLWLPPTADGPGQALSGPGMNQVGGGYPIYLDSKGASVTDVQAALTYNPALLAVRPTSTATFAVAVPSAGTAALHYSGPALAAGSQTPIGFLIAAVPFGTAPSPMPYKAENLLHLSAVVLNGGSLPVTTSDGLHLVAYVGDADGNGSYSSSDALLITRVTLQTDTGFAAYPLVDPVIVADTDGSGFIPSDAALQVNEAGVGVPTQSLAIPPIPSGVHFMARVEHAPLAARTVTEVFSSTEPTTKNTKDTMQESALDAVLVDPWLDVSGIARRKPSVPLLARR